jgi:HAD superfamily hydrolase (TIGR01484 family)
MLPDKKIIAFDLDGTLTVSKSPITIEMANLVRDLLKHKIVVIISGGSFKLVSEKQFLPKFIVDDSLLPFVDNLKIITTSGTQRYEYDKSISNWVQVDKVGMDESVKDKVKKIFKEIIDDPKYGIPKNPIGDIVEDRETQITLTPNGQLAPVELKMKFDPTREKRENIVAVVAPQVPELDFLINGISSIDVVSKGCNKGFGLLRMLKSLNLTKDDMLFVGDAIFPGGNDYSAKEVGIETISVSGPEETEVLLKSWTS